MERQGRAAILEAYSYFYQMLEERLRISAKQIERWGRPDKPANKDVLWLANAAEALLAELYPRLTEHRPRAGSRGAIVSSNWNRLERVLPLLVLYTDELIVLSGVSPKESEPVAMNREGIVFSDMPLWVRDTLRLKPAVKSGNVICLPRNYFNGYPGVFRAAWILAQFKFAEEHDPSQALHPESVFGELAATSALGAMVSRVDQPTWRDQALAVLGSAHEITWRLLAEIDLPFLQNIDVATLCKLKNDYAESFGAFRTELQRRIEHARSFSPDATLEDLRVTIEADWIGDGISKLTSDLKRESQRRWATSAGVVVATGSIAVSAMTASPWPAIVAAGSTAALELARSLLDRGSADLSSTPLFGLWKMKQKSSTAKGA